jgi:molybdenum-dependent DNA-binding transcriptional regulator ModE
MNQEEILSIFAQQQSVEENIRTTVTSLLKHAHPFGEWDHIGPLVCKPVIKDLTALLEDVQECTLLFRKEMMSLWVAWSHIEELVENAEISTVAYREVCASMTTSVLHDRRRLSKKYKELKQIIGEALENNQRWREEHFKELFGEDLVVSRHLTVITEIKGAE